MATLDLTAAAIGLPLPGEVRDALARAVAGLRAGEHIPPEGYYVSVAEIVEPQPGLLLDRAEAALKALRAVPFQIALDGFATDGGSRPTALMARATLPMGLKDLHKAVGAAVREAGIDLPFQRYEPYVVVAEFPELGPHDLRAVLDFANRRAGFSAGPWPVTELCLHAFPETPQGLAQELRATIPLMG